MQTEIPFRLAGEKFPLLLVSTFVNEHGPFDFIVDTGASHCLLSMEVAHSLGLTWGEASEGKDAGGTIQIFKSRLASLSVGAVTREDIPVGVVDLGALSQTLGIPIAGNLGANYFRGLSMTIDYQHEMLYLFENQQVDIPGSAAEGVSLPLKVTPLLLVPVIVNGQGPFDFVLDTGASATVISPELAGCLELLATGATRVVGAKNIGMARRCVLSSLSVGTTTQLQHSVCITDIFGPLRQKIGTSFDGILGYPYLCAFRVTIDYAHSTLLLQAS